MLDQFFQILLVFALLLYPVQQLLVARLQDGFTPRRSWVTPLVDDPRIGVRMSIELRVPNRPRDARVAVDFRPTMIWLFACSSACRAESSTTILVPA